MGYFDYPIEKECFIRFSLLIINERKICGVVEPRDLIARYLLKCQLRFQI